MSSARSGGVPGRRGRRRVERPSTAPFVDRSWDQPGAEDLFSLGGAFARWVVRAGCG